MADRVSLEVTEINGRLVKMLDATETVLSLIVDSMEHDETTRYRPEPLDPHDYEECIVCLAKMTMRDAKKLIRQNKDQAY